MTGFEGATSTTYLGDNCQITVRSPCFLSFYLAVRFFKQSPCEPCVVPVLPSRARSQLGK